jgi:hypothetical protein
VTLARSCIDIHRQTRSRRRIPIALRAAVTRQAVRFVRTRFEQDVLRRPIPPPPI